MIYNKTDLKLNRLENIYDNSNNEVSASMVGTFCDNFIDSIYDYSDTKWSKLETFELYKLGISGSSYIDYQNNSIYFSGLTQTFKLNDVRYIDFDSSDTSISIRDNVIIDDNGIYLSSGYIRGKFKSFDGYTGDSFSDTIYGLLNDTILEVENGIVINYTQTGFTMQVDVFGLDDDPGAPISGATVIVDSLMTLTTNSVGRVTFYGRLDQVYSLRISAPGPYDPTTYPMTCTTDPTLLNVTLPYTG